MKIETLIEILTDYKNEYGNNEVFVFVKNSDKRINSIHGVGVDADKKTVIINIESK